ncbi:MAG TPA: Xaa-Pro peptidase family protein [Gemmatimonadaceae bacterium]|nr:Xaa-Pro peptidase family protein [Gemmatimonadaceae bacterium]
MTDSRRNRLEALRNKLSSEKVDGLLLSSLPNIRYLTGFSGSSALVLVTQTDVVFVTDFRYETQVADQVGDLANVRVEPSSLWTGLWDSLPRLDTTEILGFESAHIVHRDFQRLLNEGSRWQWRPHVGLVEGLRESKDPHEVALITEAARIATDALGRVIPMIRAGLTELEVAGILEKALRDEGSEDAPFPPIVASGPRAALPHARASKRVIERGDFLLLDFGAQHEGYCSDVTRTFVVGAATAEQREVYEVVKEANHIAAGQVAVGMTGIAADTLARSYIERRGHGAAFGHGLGHGLGLEVHEAPRLGKTAEAALKQGAVVTIEPGIYRAGWGGVRIEDDVHLSATGPRVLTNFSRELLEVA